jgi:O-antigen/teichoic acid export membrane protein
MGFLHPAGGAHPVPVIATRLYGAEALGRFASALVLIEIVALICSLGEKRGLAQRLSEGAGENRAAETNLVYDGILLALAYSAVAAVLLLAFPEPMFPNGTNRPTGYLAGGDHPRLCGDRDPARSPGLSL